MATLFDTLNYMMCLKTLTKIGNNDWDNMFFLDVLIIL